MTIATKNGTPIAIDGSIARDCGCCDESCCTRVLFSGFAHSCFAEAFSVRPLGAGNSISLDLSSQSLGSGTWCSGQVLVTGTPSGLSVEVKLGVDVYDSLGSDNVIRYTNETYTYAYFSSGSSLSGLCRQNGIYLSAVECTSITKRLSSAFPGRRGVVQSGGSLVAPPGFAGDIQIQLGTTDTSARFISGDTWTNINEIVIEFTSEITGNDTMTFPANANLGLREAECVFAPLSYELSLHRVGSYGSTSTSYAFSDGIPLESKTIGSVGIVSPDEQDQIRPVEQFGFTNWQNSDGRKVWDASSTFDCPASCTLLLAREPSCADSGKMYAQFSGVGSLPVASVQRTQETWMFGVTIPDTQEVDFGMTVKNDGNSVYALSAALCRVVSPSNLGQYSALAHDAADRLRQDSTLNAGTIFGQALPFVLSPLVSSPEFASWTTRFQAVAIGRSSEFAAGGGSPYRTFPLDQFVDVTLTAKIVAFA